jgi:hypothetical protein
MSRMVSEITPTPQTVFNDTINDAMITLHEHLKILRKADERFLDDTREINRRFEDERDRRYAEVNIEKEKALKIKETADLAALQLAREIQTYKDEKANELRSQIERERGTYVTQAELRGLEDKLVAMLKPVTEYVSLNQGKSGGLHMGWTYLIAIITVGIALYAILKT